MPTTPPLTPKRKPGRPAPPRPLPVDMLPEMVAQEQSREPLLADVEEAATALHVCTKTVWNLIARGQLPAKRIGRRVLVPWAALRAYAAKVD